MKFDEVRLIAMRNFRFLSLIVLVPVTCFAQPTAAPSCEYSLEKKISFRSANASDLVKVAIGPGACHSAQLTISVRTKEGKTLYRYQAPFKKHTAVSWEDADLPKVAKKFVEDTANDAIVSDAEMPVPVTRDALTEENHFLLVVSRTTYDRLRRTRQPVFYHATYYEGGVFLIFDPNTKRVARVIEWGL